MLKIVDSQPGKAKLVIVAVCTYKRPKMLDACLSSLAAQDVPSHIMPQIVIIDNDPEGSAKDAYNRFVNGCPFWASYVHQPKRGIAAARNAAIDYAIRQDADFLAFIDDDSIANENWLASLMHPDYEHASIVGGWNVISYPIGFPEWARPRLKDKKEGCGSVTGSGNIRLSSSVFKSFRFNEALGLGGGEDGEFLMHARKAGMEIRFTKRAITYETAHPERYTVKGILHRSHWIAAANMREEMIKYGRVKAVAKRSTAILFSPLTAAALFVAGACYFAIDTTKARRKVLKAGTALAVASGRWEAICGRVPQAYTVTVGE